MKRNRRAKPREESEADAKCEVLYWPDFVCDEESRAISHPSTIHEHYMDEDAAALAFLRLQTQWFESAIAGDPKYTTGDRYACVFVPGKGLVRGVKL